MRPRCVRAQRRVDPLAEVARASGRRSSPRRSGSPKLVAPAGRPAGRSTDVRDARGLEELEERDVVEVPVDVEVGEADLVGVREGPVGLAHDAQRNPVALGAGSSGLPGSSGGQRFEVVDRRRDVVGRVGVKERREVLDLPAADAELRLPAAVQRDPLARAVVVEVEQRPQAAEARGLGVERARREGQREDVRDGVDRGVPRDPRRGGRSSTGVVSLVEQRILDPGVRQALGDPAVELRVGGVVDGGAGVEALQIGGRDEIARGELARSAPRPSDGVGSSLKRSPGWWASRSSTGSSVGGSGRRTDATNVTGAGARPSASCSEHPGLAQREVERRGLEGPARGSCGRPRCAAGRGRGRGRRDAPRTPSSVQLPASGSIGPAASSAS